MVKNIGYHLTAVTVPIRRRPSPGSPGHAGPDRPRSTGQKWTDVGAERRGLLAEFGGGPGRETDLEVIVPF
jgi:hypothetical protein